MNPWWYVFAALVAVFAVVGWLTHHSIHELAGPEERLPRDEALNDFIRQGLEGVSQAQRDRYECERLWSRSDHPTGGAA